MANAPNTTKNRAMTPRTVKSVEKNHWKRSLSCRNFTPGNRTDASRTAIVSGMNMLAPRYRATEIPSMAERFSPILVAAVRLRFISRGLC